MGTAGWIILIVVVLVVAAAAAWALMGNRRTQAQREQAAHLRDEATEKAAAVEASRREAEEAAARAEVARAEAARAEEQAAQAQQGVQYEQASVEDRLRTADEVDPDVNTRTQDYEPVEPTATAPETGGGTTYADPADTPAGTPVDSTDTDPDEPAHQHQHVHRRDPS